MPSNTSDIRHDTLRILRKTTHILVTMAAAFAVAWLANSCSNIDCPLENTVSATYNFYETSTGASALITDTITVTTAGSDSVIFNRGYNISGFELPMGYKRTVDTLIIRIANTTTSTTDTLFVTHTNEPHFESVDCATAMFHVVKNVELASHTSVAGLTKIDSIAVTNPKVNYNAKENFKIYLTLP